MPTLSLTDRRVIANEIILKVTKEINETNKKIRETKAFKARAQEVMSNDFKDIKSFISAYKRYQEAEEELDKQLRILNEKYPKKEWNEYYKQHYVSNRSKSEINEDLLRKLVFKQVNEEFGCKNPAQIDTDKVAIMLLKFGNADIGQMMEAVSGEVERLIKNQE